MNFNRNLLSDAVRYGLAAGAMGLLGLTAAPAFAQDEEEAARLDRIEVTGSRIKRAEVEGALPVSVIDRQEIEASGKTTVADVLQNTTFNSFGSLKPSSGSSAQSFSELSLRGFGGGRTLILIDGRRAPKSPQFLAGGQDLNTLPLAAVERIELLTDGASAIYGADAMAGVVNIITRKDYNGAEVTYGVGNHERGGDTEEGSFLIGTASDTTRLLAGASYTNRGITFWDDLPWLDDQRGVTSFSNLYKRPIVNPVTGQNIPGSIVGNVPGGCTNELFYINPANGLCMYDFLRIGAATASLDTRGAFFRGDHQIDDNWMVYVNGSVTRTDSFGRFAPTPENIFVSAASPNNTTGEDMFIGHRFATMGPRDNFDENTVYDLTAGFQGRLTDRIGLEAGIRRNEARFDSVGYNYVNIPVAEQLFESGEYNVFDPAGNPESVLAAIRTTTNRSGFFTQDELFALMDFDLFEMAGGASMMAIGAEYREEDYADIYDQQSAAGNVGGSSGNSSFGDRDLTSVFAEWNLPILSNLEANIAARYDDYSDFGDSVSPKVSLRYQPLDALSFRGSWGEGFRAPPLSIINQLDSFSADTVGDAQNCAALSLGASCRVQINGLRVATPDLEPEESEQFSLGVVWDATSWLNMSLDYYDIKITDQVRFYSAQTVVNRTRNNQFLPSHLGVLRDPSGLILEVRAGYGNEGDIESSGYDLNVQTRFDFGTWGALSNALQVSYTEEFVVTSPGTGTSFDAIDTSHTPQWRATLANRWAMGDFSVQWNINVIDGVSSVLEGDYGYTCDELVGYGYNPTTACSAGTYVTHDIQASWNAPWNGKLTIGAENAFSKNPPLDEFFDTSYVNNNLHDLNGRHVYFRYTQTF